MRDIAKRQRITSVLLLFSVICLGSVRAQTCGNGVLEDGEECEGGDAARCLLCQIQPGFLCLNAFRADINVRGKRTELVSEGGINVLKMAVDGTFPEGFDETCLGAELCQAEQFVGAADNPGVENDGWYCPSVCDKFTSGGGLEYKQSCALTPIDECKDGTSECDSNAFCVETPTGIGYDCRCDSDFFVGKIGGKECLESGIELVMKVKQLDAALLMADVVALRTTFVNYLMTKGYIRTGGVYSDVTVALIDEGLYDHPPETLSIDSVSFWYIKVRIPTKYANMEMVSKGLLFKNYEIFDFTLEATKFLLEAVHSCSNEATRECSTNGECLAGGVCLKHPDITTNVLVSGGSNTPIKVETSSANVISVRYDPLVNQLKMRVRYSNTDPLRMDVLYLSHIEVPLTALEAATFNSDEFPCLPAGTGEVATDQQNTVCCMANFYAKYNTLTTFLPAVSDSTMSREIQKQGACVAPNFLPPSNHTIDLLDNIVDQKAVDYTAGSFFKGMTARSSATLDPANTRGYKDVNILLAVEDIETHGGIITSLPRGKRLKFFVGMAHFKGMKSDRISMTHSQTTVTLDITETYFFSTAGPTSASSFIQDVSVVLREIRNCCSDNTTKFATITVIVPDTVTATDPLTVIALDSIVVGRGVFRTEMVDKTYPCVSLYADAGKTAIDEVLKTNAWCGLRDPMCIAQGDYVNTVIGPGGTIVITVPLPDTMWDKIDITENPLVTPESIFIDFMLTVTGDDGKRLMTTLQTEATLTPTSITTMCTETAVEGGIGDIMNIDIYLGLAGVESDFNSSLLSILNFTSASPPLVRNIATKESNVMTVLFKGADELFNKDFSQGYTLAVEDMITIHMINPAKKAAVVALIAEDKAFKVEPQAPGEASKTLSKLVPTEALLRECPFQATRGNFGCISRREIEQRVMDFRTNSITSLTGRGNYEEGFDDIVHKRNGLWTQQLLGGSEYAKELGYNHSKLMHQRNNLNARYRNGFVVAPTIPWSRKALQENNINSIFELAQSTITSMLVSYDKNQGRAFVPSVELVLPLNLGLTDEAIVVNQQKIKEAFAYAAGLTPGGVVIDVSSILELNSDVRRRRLLSSDGHAAAAVSSFNMVVLFEGSNLGETIEAASDFRSNVADENSLQSKNIDSYLKSVLTEQVVDFSATPSVVDRTKPIVQPRALDVCHDSTKWELDVSTLLNLQLGSTSNGHKRVAVVGCLRRTLRLQKKDGSFVNQDDRVQNINMRGPMEVDEWREISRAHVVESDNWMHGWQWWDFCADPPVTPGYNPKFLQEWNKVRAQASSQCCVCKKVPKIAGTNRNYKHAYSWPIVLENAAFSDIFVRLNYPMHSRLFEQNSYKVNPQIRNFRVSYGASAAQFDTENAYRGNVLPPKTWDIDYRGRTVAASCGAGQFLSSIDWCDLCDVNTYKYDDLVALSGQDDAHKRGGVCSECPASSVAPQGSLSVRDCECTRGFFHNHDAACVMCPPSTYKATFSNTDTCVACPSGSTSRSGSTELRHCIQTPDLNKQTLYQNILGLVYYRQPVVPQWKEFPAFLQDQQRLCVLVDGLTSLDCGYEHIPVSPGTGTDAPRLSFQNPARPQELMAYYQAPNMGRPQFLQYDNDVAVNRGSDIPSISLLVRPGYMGPSPPGFSERIASQGAWEPGTKFSASLRVLARAIDFSQRDVGSAVYMVTFISSKKLSVNRNSVDWNWIVCGHKTADGSGSDYAFCADQQDPDAPKSRNQKNRHILDGQITRLNSDKCCESCYYQNSWMKNCSTHPRNPDSKNMYDHTVDWTPFADAALPKTSVHGDLWVYTYFTVGESEACVNYNCDEEMLFRNMQMHLRTRDALLPDVAVEFLPGTLFSVAKHPKSVVEAVVVPGTASNFHSRINGHGYVKQVNDKKPWISGTVVEIQPSVDVNLIPSNVHVRMNIFVTSAKLADPDSQWITCGAYKHHLLDVMPHSLSTISDDRALANFLTDSFLHDRLAQDGQPALPYTSYATSSNAWTSHGGFLPPPSLCTASSRANCKVDEIVLLGTTGYARCNLAVGFGQQALPCMYTLGDVAEKYSVTEHDIARVRNGEMLSMYESDRTLPENVRSLHGDAYTKKIAYGSAGNHSYTGMLYLCHTQYNNLPENTVHINMLRPNVACGLSADNMIADIADCVCGIVTNAYRHATPSTEHTTMPIQKTTYLEKFIRIVPETDCAGNGEKQQSPSTPRVFIAELSEASVVSGDVLALGQQSPEIENGVGFYFEQDPSMLNYEHHDYAQHKATSYHMCEDEFDPDNAPARNHKNPLVLDGIVIELGSKSAPVLCCGLLTRHSRDHVPSTMCPETCYTDGTYENANGIVKWTPAIPNVEGHEYWLYVTYDMGDSEACQYANCDESTAVQHASAHSTHGDVLTKSNLFDQTTVHTLRPFSAATSGRSMLSVSATNTGANRGLLSIADSAPMHGVNRAWARRKFSSAHTQQQAPRNVRTQYSPDVVALRRQHSESVPREEIEAEEDPSKHKGNRMILSTSSDKPAAEDDVGGTTASREITGLNNNNQIVEVICGKNSTKCDLLIISKKVPISDYCSTEEFLSDKYQPILSTELRDATAGAITSVVVTSVTTPKFAELCSNRNARRLLQIETIQIAVVVNATSNTGYIVDETIMLLNNNVAFTRKSDLSSMRFEQCGTQQACVAARAALHLKANPVAPPIAAVPRLPTSPPPTTPTPSAVFPDDNSGEETSQVNTMAIVGAVVGGVVFLGIVAFVINWWSRSPNTVDPRQLQQQGQVMSYVPVPTGPTPMSGGQVSVPFPNGQIPFNVNGAAANVGYHMHGNSYRY